MKTPETQTGISGEWLTAERVVPFQSLNREAP
jgi:hypothetical protein